MRFRAYDVVERAISEGVSSGWRRAHKHVDEPEEDWAIEAIRQEVLNALCGVLKFDTVEFDIISSTEE